MPSYNAHRVWLILGVALGVPSLFLDQLNGQPATVLDLPFGRITQLASPDGSLILYGGPFQKGVNKGSQLWLEDGRTHRRQKLLDISRQKLLDISEGVSAGWSPDGMKFYLQDHSSSSSTESHIYDARSLKRVDLGAMIRKSDSSISRFGAGHAYVDMERWEGPDTVIVHFYGHTDEPPVVCCDVHYQVKLGGTPTVSYQNLPLGGRCYCSVPLFVQ
jgi:hypothetical protein